MRKELLSMNTRSLFSCFVFWMVALTGIAGAAPTAGEVARATTLPKVEFEKTELRQAVSVLTVLSEKKAKAGMNVLVAIPFRETSVVTLRLEEKSAFEILNELAGQAGCKVYEEKSALILRKSDAGPIPPIRGNPAVIAMWEKHASRLVMPRADFREASVRESLEFVIQKSKQLDPEAGLNVELEMAPAAEAKGGAAAKPVAAVPGLPGLPEEAPVAANGSRAGPPLITISMRQIAVLDLLRYIAALGDLEVVADERKLRIQPIARK